MALFLNFITALAWLWGALMAIGVFLYVAAWEPESPERIAEFVAFGILAWAWLLARYAL